MKTIVTAKTPPVIPEPNTHTISPTSGSRVIAQTLTNITNALTEHITHNEQPVRPFWLATPCPAWCDVTHRDGDYYEDRHHVEFSGSIDLTLYDGGTPDEGESGELTLIASQHYRQVEPEIALVVPLCEPHRAHRVTGETQVEMTVTEAYALRDALSALLTKVEQGTSSVRGALHA